MEAAGWKVEWRDERWLNALATAATREGLTVDEAIAEFEEVTGQNYGDLGCECCGPPHYISEDW